MGSNAQQNENGKCSPAIRVLILIVAYDAESHIGSVLERIPQDILGAGRYRTRILILDDASHDRTVAMGEAFRSSHSEYPIDILSNPVNQGYGGNQKVGFHYALRKGYDIVVLLHGDGQYAPEKLPEIIEPIAEGKADAVIGSRMLRKLDALRGGMPFYKFIGNIVLSTVQNRLLGSTLSEFHSGYRAYSTSILRSIPFRFNANGFSFDTDILIQLVDCKARIAEVAIPTYYGDEICHVSGIPYAWNVLAATVRSRLQKHAAIVYHPKFDYEAGTNVYTSKLGYNSSHQFAVDRVESGKVVLDLACGPGHVGAALKHKGCTVHGVDRQVPDGVPEGYASIQELDLDTIDENSIAFGERRLDYLLLLDVVEHLESPEGFLRTLREQFSGYRPEVIITVPNVAFFVQRMGLFLGFLNYGRKGVLDMTHRRLFTFRSLRRLLENEGYVITRMAGIPAPWRLIFGEGLVSRALQCLNEVLIVIHRGLFSYQVACVARPGPSLDVLLGDAVALGSTMTGGGAH
jgi:glycosyltransferase involved in cell wall biosynthesis